MNIRPLKDKIFVILEAVKEGKTAGGIILPDMHSEQSRIGTVQRVGEKVTMVNPGDKVYIMFYAGVAVHNPLEGILKDTHRFITEDEVLGVIEE